MSGWKAVKQPVFGSKRQAVRQVRAVVPLGANYYRKGGGYRDLCTKCLASSRRQTTGGLRMGYGAPRRRR